VLVTGTVICRVRRTGNPVRIRNGPAAVTERSRVSSIFVRLLPYLEQQVLASAYNTSLTN